MIERQLRLWSGLVLAIFITVHLCNHALGLISIDAMEAMRTRIMPVWQSAPGTDWSREWRPVAGTPSTVRSK